MSRRIGEQGVYLLDPATGQQVYLEPGSKVTEDQAARLGSHVFDDYDPDKPPTPPKVSGSAVITAPSQIDLGSAGGQGQLTPEVRVVVSPIPGDTDGYEAMTVPDLRAIAEARGVDVPSSANKPDIVDALLDADDELYAALAALGGGDGEQPATAGGEPAVGAPATTEGTTPPAEPKGKAGGRGSA